jgi:hypothetical protein
MAHNTLIRTGLSPDEWAQIRDQATAQDVTAKKLVTDTLRGVLLKRPKAGPR